MKLVLAEKPSVAQSIAKVLGAAKREDGYLEGNGYVVSWCVGHLVELAQPEVYDAKYSKWAYHTQIGYNVFHICQFAEIMERNGASYMPEPEIMGDEAAWKVGKDRILAVQTCEDGYDYTLLDENYNEIDGGQVDNPELSMLEVRRDILESFGLERRELRAMFYEDVMEQAFEVGRQAVVVNDPIAELAFKLDRFAENFDPYEYMDQVDDVQAHIQEIKADLAAGNTAPYREFLNTAIEEAREETAVEVAKVLKSQLDKLDSPKRESVMEKLAQAAEKAAPASPSPKRKEPER